MLEARNLSFGFDRRAPVIRDLSIAVEVGEMVAITGPSGRGKSTLLYLLGLMLIPVDGSIWVNGVNMTPLRDYGRASERARSFGFVFQDAALDPTRSTIDNIVETALYRSEPRNLALNRAATLMEQFGVTFQANARPGQVSGGQAQRIALCRALLGKPKIILADEPTGNLDLESAAVVIDGLQAEADRGGSVVLVTHDASIARQCDRTIVL